MLKRLFSKQRAIISAPPGERLYAIGDIHGRLDLLDQLLAEIDADDRRRPSARTTLIFLGDLIDRGPDSAAVVERLRLLARDRPEARFLMGNHEDVLLCLLDGSERALRGFTRIGGRETVLSYGIDADAYERMDYDQLREAIQAAVPPEHAAFLRTFEDLIVLGDYAFVHAGIHPDSPLADQRLEDLRWIREPFLSHKRALEKMIVHGHTIAPAVETRPHRIGIDTGAYETGVLTALGLEGAERWVLQT